MLPPTTRTLARRPGRPVPSWRARSGARLRLALARQPRLYWLAVGLCAGVVGLVVARSTARLETARAAWGETRRVIVVTTATPSGVRPAVETRDLPVVVLPAAALDALPPSGVAAHGLAAGEVVTANDLVDPLVADGVRLAVPARGAPALTIGQTALLLTVDGARCEGPVLARDDEWLDVAVPEQCATPVALALLAGDLVVAAVDT